MAGPLLGGWLTDGPGWRWIFYINIPVGLAALVVTSAALKMPVVRRQHQIDYLGAAAIVGAVTCLLLYLDWRGNEYGWTEPGAMVLLGGAVLLAAAFVLIERRAAEPIIPLRLFRNPVFSVGNAFAFLAGVAMFGTIIFLPVYLQAVKGFSPTQSGLALLPAIIGIFSTSITSGQLITRTGRYKIFPVIGAAVMTVALLAAVAPRRGHAVLAGRASTSTCSGPASGSPCRRSSPPCRTRSSTGTWASATSSTTFFRQMGGSVGAAVFGAVLSSRLAHYLAQQLAEAGIQHRRRRAAGRGQQRPGHPAARRAGQEHRARGLHQRPRRRVPGRGAVPGRSPS